MGRYTDFFKEKMLEISLEKDDDFKEKLEEIASSFRNFDEGLTEFISSKGYIGDKDDIEAKVAYIKSKFDHASIPVPRNIKKWFTEHKRIEKKTALQLCFAFNLSVEESDEFLRKVCLQRGIDCHYIEEAIYYYSLNNQLCYSEARGLMEKAPKDDKEKIDFDTDILYTGTIINEINKFRSSDELIKFFNDNISQFGYNNATAYSYIKDIWNEISGAEGKEGLAVREEKELFLESDMEGLQPEDVDGEKSYSEEGVFKKKKRKKHTVEHICQQILFETPVSAIEKDRSLNHILKNNPLLHPLAVDSFPERQGLEAILRGEHKSNELVRKTMILLVFYKFWVSISLKRKDGTYQAQDGDDERCRDEIDKHLIEAGYPALYAGNPYDWVFLYSTQDVAPLNTFRYIMREIYLHKEAEISGKT